MGKKEETPLQTTIKADDTLKKTVDKLVKQCESHIKKKNPDRREGNELYSNCKEQLKEIGTQLDAVGDLVLDNEPSLKENKFKSKKNDELKKLNTLKDKLSKVEEKIKPDDVEEGEVEKDDESGEEEEEDSGEEEEDDEEDDDEDEEDEGEDDEVDDNKSAQTSGNKKSVGPLAKDKKGTKPLPEEEESIDEDVDEDEESEEEEDEESEEEEEVPRPTPRPTPKSRTSEPPPSYEKVAGPIKKKEAQVEKSAPPPRKTQPKAAEPEEEDEDDDDDEDTVSQIKHTPPPKWCILAVVSRSPTEVTEEEESEDEEELDDDEEDEETEGEDETEGLGSSQGTIKQYEALVDCDGEMDGDLGFKAGEILTIVSARSDGWLEAKNAKGQQGLVPITYLKVYNKSKHLQTQKEEESEEESESEEEEEGESEEEASPRSPTTPRSGRVLWKNIRQAVKETSVTDVLQAMGAVPAGFRESTLAKLLAQDQYSAKAYLLPKLSQSCLSYRDLHIDTQTNRIRARAARVLRIVQLVAARQIPAPGAGLDITSRHVRICLFDGKNMLSNIHTINVANVDKDQRTWNFNIKVTDNLKTQEFGEIFLRANTTDTNIGILFELCMSYVRRSTEQAGEFSCGWVFLPLFDQEGRPTEYRSYDEILNGGTPFEKGVDVDPSVGRRENAGMLRTLMGGNKQPRLVFRLLEPTKDQKLLLDTLPDVLVSNTVYIQYLSFYRQILTDSVIKDNDDVQSIEGIHSPVLTTFPQIADKADLMDVLRIAWAEQMKIAKRGEKKDQDLKKIMFKRVFMDSVFPLCHASSIPPYKATDHEVMQARHNEMQRLLKINKQKKFAACLLSPDATFEPFDVQELSFNVINDHCITQHHKV